MKKDMFTRGYATTGDIARRFNIPFPTVRNWVASGKIEAIQMENRRYAIPLIEVARLEMEQEKIQRDLQVLTDKIKGA